MNITQLIGTTRDVLDDTVGRPTLKFDDPELVRTTDEQARSLFRTMVHGNKEYHNFTMYLQKESAKLLMKDVYQWRLPTWIAAIVRVNERTPSTSGIQESTFSSYLWGNPAQFVLGREIPKGVSSSSIGRPRTGWQWEGQHTLRLWNYTTPPELVVRVAKIPPRMFRAKITTASGDTSIIYLPTTFELGAPDTEEGAVINAEIQVTSCANALSKNQGVVRRVIYSSAAEIVNNTRQHILRLEEPFPSAIEQNDVIETMIPIPDEHARYLALRIVQACAQKKGNVNLLKTIAGELATETQLFMQYASPPRDFNGPYSRSSRSPGAVGDAPYNPDRARVPYLWSI